MQEYTLAVGGKINFNKTDGILFGLQDGGILPENIDWKYPNHALRYLGIMFGSGCTEKWDKLVNNIKSIIASWKRFHLSDIGKARLWNQLMLSTLIHNMKGSHLPQKHLDTLGSICRTFITTKRQQYKIKTLIKPPTEGGVGLITPKTAWISLTMKWWTDMFMQPKGFWQIGMWKLITKLCADFKTQLQQRTIPRTPPNTSKPLLWR